LGLAATGLLLPEISFWWITCALSVDKQKSPHKETLMFLIQAFLGLIVELQLDNILSFFIVFYGKTVSFYFFS
jgi:multisubunit Na+/H+ antiporter MnhB subunit